MRQIEMTVCGVDCIVKLHSWEPYRPAKLGGAPEDCYPAEGGYGDWEICDVSGRPATELAQQMTDFDVEQVEKALFEYMED